MTTALAVSPSAASEALPARPSLQTLQRFARTLDRLLAGSHIDRVWRPDSSTLLIDFRMLGKQRLFANLASRTPWVAVTSRWPETPSAPDRETLMLRKCLEGARVVAVHVEDERRLLFELGPRAEYLPVLAIQLAGRYANAAVLDRKGTSETELVRLIPDRPAIDPESPPLQSGPVPFDALPDDAWLEALADAQWATEDLRQLELRRTSLVREARQTHQRKKRSLDALEADLLRAHEAESVRHRGELLKASLYLVKPGMRDVAVVDWNDPEGQSVVIELDPTLSGVENLQRIFARYRKLARGEAAIAERLVKAREETAIFADVLERLTTATTLAELDTLERELRSLGVRAPAAPNKHEPSERLPYRRFTASDGTEILVGKSAKDNDDLTFHVARGSDLFLHARDVAGSHVILRKVGKNEPSSEALIDAATLAAHASKLRTDSVVDVLYIERKHVRKPRGAAPGLVQTGSPKTLTVRLDPDRIQRLYATLDPHERDA